MDLKENKTGVVALLIILLIVAFFIIFGGENNNFSVSEIDKITINEKTLNDPKIPTQFRGFVGRWEGVWTPSSSDTKEESKVTLVVGDVKPGEDILVAYSWEKNSQLNLPAGFTQEKGSVNQKGDLIVSFNKEPLTGARFVLKPGPLVKNDTGGEWVSAIEGEYFMGEKSVFKGSFSRQVIR